MAFRALAGAAALALAPTAGQAACKVEKYADLPVTMDGFQPMVRAKINGVDTSFIIDSGAFYSMMAPGVAGAAKLRLERTPDEFRVTGIGGSIRPSIARVKDLIVAGIPVHNIEFFVGGTDDGSAGLLGQNVLGVGDVEYDLPDGFVRLMRSHDCGGTDLAYWANGGSYSLVRIDPRDATDQPFTMATVYVNGTAMHATFDTGATRTIMSLQAAARIGIKPDSKGVKPAGYGNGIGRGISQTWLAPVASIRIGDEEIHNPSVLIGDAGGDTDMLIGADFFISHRVYVDNSAHRMFFTYTGGELFGRSARAGAQAPMAAAAPAGAIEPKDADGFSRRGAVFAAQHDRIRALADFGRAIELAPKDPRYRVQRAEALLADDHKTEALADLDAAIAADPANLSALIDRAALRIEDKKFDDAIRDADAAARAAPPTVAEHFQIGGLYEEAHAYGPAIEQFRLWIAAHPDDAQLPEALNARCWTRALANQALDQALDDCNAALRLRPHTPSFLDSRGLVRVRMGQWDKAIADYDEALKAEPKIAWSLYGRSIARRHKGLAAEATADVAAAVAIDKDLPDRAKKDGID